jgi:hypothetical protein
MHFPFGVRFARLFLLRHVSGADNSSMLQGVSCLGRGLTINGEIRQFEVDPRRSLLASLMTGRASSPDRRANDGVWIDQNDVRISDVGAGKLTRHLGRHLNAGKARANDHHGRSPRRSV